MKFITLLTDFGLQDGYNGIMKGVIWKIAPGTQIADISHSIEPQNVLKGALALRRTARYFPNGTIHIAVVDPGVGTHRRPMAAKIGNYFFVGPDNGLATFLIEDIQKEGGEIKIVHLDRPEYWLNNISNVFHGRDIFAPVAAHMANGVTLEDLGTPVVDPVKLSQPKPEPIAGGWRGEVISIDHFGNLSTNLGADILASFQSPTIKIKGQEIHHIIRTFGERQPGTLAAVRGTQGELYIAIVQGSASEILQAQCGDKVEIIEKGS